MACNRYDESDREALRQEQYAKCMHYLDIIQDALDRIAREIGHVPYKEFYNNEELNNEDNDK